MCGRIARDRDDLADEVGFTEIQEKRVRVALPDTLPAAAPAHEPMPVRFNIAPTQRDVIIRDQGDGRRTVSSFWGLVPSWAKDRSGAAKLINARAETLMERPSFRNLVRRNRCVIPVTGFYEWSQTGGKKTPMHIRRADGGALALAGLWTVWCDPTSGEDITSHTIITTEANALMARFHHRMPIVLDQAGIDRWLDPFVEEPAAVLPLLVPCPDDVLIAYPVAPLVNNVRNDGPQLIMQLDG